MNTNIVVEVSLMRLTKLAQDQSSYNKLKSDLQQSILGKSSSGDIIIDATKLTSVLNNVVSA